MQNNILLTDSGDITCHARYEERLMYVNRHESDHATSYEHCGLTFCTLSAPRSNRSSGIPSSSGREFIGVTGRPPHTLGLNASLSQT